MSNFIADITYIDDNNILKRDKKHSFESDNITNAVFILKDKFTIIKIRSLIEKEDSTVKNYSFLKK